MEVEVLGVSGAPDGAILSVRAGGQRRQAPAASIGQSKTAFRFATGPNGVNPFRVDLLKPVGSARLALRPGEGNYTTILRGANSEGDNVKVKFAVCEAGKGPPLAAPAEAEEEVPALEKPGVVEAMAAASSDGRLASIMAGQAPALSNELRGGKAKLPPLNLKDEDGHFPIQAAVAKDYLERHNLLPFVRALLQTVIRERPADPFGFIEEQFRSAAGCSLALQSKGDADLITDKPPPLPKESPAPDPVAVIANIAKASADGSLVTKLAEQAAAPKTNFVHMPSSGTWLMRRPAHQKEPEVRRNIELKFQRGQFAMDASGKEEEYPPPPSGPVAAQDDNQEHIKKLAREVLWQASADGRLEDVIMSVTQASAQSGEEDMRRRAQELLFKASADGSLTEALEATLNMNIASQEHDALFNKIDRNQDGVISRGEWHQAPEAFQKVLAHGTSTIAQEFSVQELEEIQQKALAALQLARGPAQHEDEEMLLETAKDKARSALLAALIDEIVPSREDNEELERIKQVAQRALEKIYLDEQTPGELDNARQKAANALEQALLVEELSPEEMEVAKAKARVALQAAMGSSGAAASSAGPLSAGDMMQMKQKAAAALHAALAPAAEDSAELENAKDAARQALEAALGGGRHEEQDAVFNKIDRNQDDVISREEFHQELEHVKAEALDALKRSVLGEEDDEAAEKLEHAKAQALDALKRSLFPENGDKDVLFNEIDRNQDGVISRGEWHQADEKLEQAKAQALDALQRSLLVDEDDEATEQLDRAKASALDALKRSLFPEENTPPPIAGEKKEAGGAPDEDDHTLKAMARNALENVFCAELDEEDVNADGVVDAGELLADVKLDAADKNNDGAMSQKEAKDANIGAQEFQDMDVNGDKVVDRTEVLADVKLDAVDKNDDGVISSKEAQQANIATKNFQDMDANKDGAVDRSEIALDIKRDAALTKALHAELAWLHQDLPQAELERKKEEARDALREALATEAEGLGLEVTAADLDEKTETAAAAIDAVLLAEVSRPGSATAAASRSPQKAETQVHLSPEEFGKIKDSAREALQATLLGEGPGVEIIADNLGALRGKAKDAVAQAISAEADAVFGNMHGLSEEHMQRAQDKAQDHLTFAIMSEATIQGADFSQAELDEAKKRASHALRASVLADDDGTITAEELRALKSKTQSVVSEVLSSDLSETSLAAMELEVVRTIKAKLQEQRTEMASSNKTLRNEVAEARALYNKLSKARSQD